MGSIHLHNWWSAFFCWWCRTRIYYAINRVLCGNKIILLHFFIQIYLSKFNGSLLNEDHVFFSCKQSSYVRCMLRRAWAGRCTKISRKGSFRTNIQWNRSRPPRYFLDLFF
jgi:hypothetical protein